MVDVPTARRTLLGLGAGALAVLSWLAFGMVSVLVVFGAAYLIRRVSPRGDALIGASVGVAGVLIWVAYTNRGGPGPTCHSIPHGVQCDGRLDPIPWFAAGAVFVAVAGGLAAHSIREHRNARSSLPE